MPVHHFREAFRELQRDHEVIYTDVDESVPFEPRTPSELGLRESIGSPSSVARLMDGIEILVVQGAPVTDEVIDASPALRLVGCARGGPVNIDVAALRERGIELINTPGKNSEAVADLTIAFLVMLSRRLPEAIDYVRRGEELSGNFVGAQFMGRDLRGSTLGLVGYGQVGRRVATRARAFGMPLIVYDPAVRADHARQAQTLDELLAESDFVSLHARAPADRSTLIDARALAAMRPGACLINTAREVLIDEDALDAGTRVRPPWGSRARRVRDPGARLAITAASPRERRPHPPPGRRDPRVTAAGRGDARRRHHAVHRRRTTRAPRACGEERSVNEELLLAIDAGTGSARAVLFTPEGEMIAAGQREYSHRPLAGVPGSQVFDSANNWRLICDCVREALVDRGSRLSAVKAVSATSMREGMVLYDASGEAIWACPNVDGRAGAESAELIASGAAREIYERSGDWVSITAPARFLWIARHEPELFASIAHVTMLGDWILQRLSGEFVTDPSLGSSSGMFELAQRDWSGRILEICGLDREVFPAVVDPGSVIGTVTPSAAADTGLRAGTPVVCGGADTQLALAGLGFGDPGQVTIVGGTFWQHTVVLDTPLVDPKGRLRTLCHTVPDRWMMEGIGFYCGMVMRWFRDAFCESELEQARREGVDVFTVLERKAATRPPGSNGVFGIFSNLMQADRWIHASPAFVGFNIDDPSSSGRIECFRAIEESGGYVSRGHHAIVEELLGHRSRSRRDVWRRGEGRAVAADRCRRARRPRGDPGRDRVDRARRRALRRGRRRPDRRRGRAGAPVPADPTNTGPRAVRDGRLR